MRVESAVRGLLAIVTFAAAALAGCDKKPDGVSGGSSSAAPTKGGGGSEGMLNGSGATFPDPFYQKLISEYGKVEKGIKINYTKKGSGAGIKEITDKVVDFGASDAPMTDAEVAAAKGILHIPMTVGSVVAIYNVKDLEHLKLNLDTLAGIYSGTIKTWNDPKIAALNAGAKLPADPISVVCRSDGSGTTAVFTDYLAKSGEWKQGAAGKDIKCVGSAQKGNDGVSAQVKSTPGAIGYVELVYARKSKQPMATLQNKAGKFVDASLDATAAAAAGAAAKMPDDLRISIVDPDGDAAYPIAAITYILVYQDQADAAKGKALAKFLWWGIHDGQQFAEALDYSKLPAEVVTKAEAKLKLMTSGGKALLEK